MIQQVEDSMYEYEATCRKINYRLRRLKSGSKKTNLQAQLKMIHEDRIAELRFYLGKYMYHSKREKKTIQREIRDICVALGITPKRIKKRYYNKPKR